MGFAATNIGYSIMFRKMDPAVEAELRRRYLEYAATTCPGVDATPKDRKFWAKRCAAYQKKLRKGQA